MRQDQYRGRGVVPDAILTLPTERGGTSDEVSRVHSADVVPRWTRWRVVSTCDWQSGRPRKSKSKAKAHPEDARMIQIYDPPAASATVGRDGGRGGGIGHN